MSAIIIDGGVVHYEMIGRGRPILFLHGWLGSWRYWMPTMVTISDKYRSYALDLWGFGDSDKSQPRYHVSDYVALIDSFVNTLGIEKPALIGHALGAVVALEYAASYPERITKIMAINLPLQSETLNHRLLNFADNSLIARLIRWRRQISYQEVQGETEKAEEEAIKTSLQSVAQMDIYRRLQMIGQQKQTMLLAVYGENDNVIDPDPIHRVNGNWSNIRPIGLPESRHFPMLDQPSKFNRLLNDFLDVETEDELSSLALKEEWRRRTR